MLKKTILTIAFAATTLLTPISFADTESLDSVVAVVNNDIITQSELNAAQAQAKQQFAASANPNAISDSKLRKMVLQQLIDQKLQLELAKNANLKITQAQVNAAISHIAEQNHFSVDELKSKLQQQGVKFSAYQKLIHDQLLVHTVQQGAVASKIHVTEADMQKAKKIYLAQMGAQHAFHVIDILTDTKDQAKAIIEKLNSGTSVDEAAPNENRDLGWRTDATLPALFLDQLQHMQTGDISSPIKAPNGYHVLKLVGTRGQAVTLTKSQLENIAYQMQFQKAVAKWVNSIRKTAYIKTGANV